MEGGDLDLFTVVFPDIFPGCCLAQGVFVEYVSEWMNERMNVPIVPCVDKMGLYSDVPLFGVQALPIQMKMT